MQIEPHLQDYVKVIMRRRWIILAFFTIFVVAALIVSLRQTPIYNVNYYYLDRAQKS